MCTAWLVWSALAEVCTVCVLSCWKISFTVDLRDKFLHWLPVLQSCSRSPSLCETVFVALLLLCCLSHHYQSQMSNSRREWVELTVTCHAKQADCYNGCRGSVENKTLLSRWSFHSPLLSSRSIDVDNQSTKTVTVHNLKQFLLHGRRE